MYDLVLPVPPKSKRPYFSTSVAASGSLTFASATYTLTDNTGTQIATGSVTGHEAPDSLSVRIWESVDAAGVPLPVGNSILELLVLTTASDSIARTEQTRIILNVPGAVSRVAFPTAADLQVFLVGLGLLSNPPSDTQKLLDLHGMASEAKTAWEQGTGYVPFIATTQTRTYTPEGASQGLPGPFIGITGLGYTTIGGSNRLFLRAGLLSVTTLTIYKTLVSSGRVLTVNSDFWLQPQSAPQWNKPYTFILFRSLQWGELDSIEIVGSWGHCATMTEDEYRAVLKLAAADAIDSLIAIRFQGLQSWTEADVTEKYDLKYGGIAQQYRDDAAKKMAMYKRGGIK